jgi:small nuclear ribonucleoprotein (snRNP)-like protein
MSLFFSLALSMQEFPVLDNIQCLLPIIENPTGKFTFHFPGNLPIPVPKVSLFELIPESFGSFTRLRERFSLQQHSNSLLGPLVRVKLHGGSELTGRLEFFDQQLNLFLSQCTEESKELQRIEREKIPCFHLLSKAAKRRCRRRWRRVRVVRENLRLFVPGARIVHVEVC